MQIKCILLEKKKRNKPYPKGKMRKSNRCVITNIIDEYQNIIWKKRHFHHLIIKLIIDQLNLIKNNFF